jgi:hypothetical protein
MRRVASVLMAIEVIHASNVLDDACAGLVPDVHAEGERNGAGVQFIAVRITIQSTQRFRTYLRF